MTFDHQPFRTKKKHIFDQPGQKYGLFPSLSARFAFVNLVALVLWILKNHPAVITIVMTGWYFYIYEVWFYPHCMVVSWDSDGITMVDGENGYLYMVFCC